MRCALHVRGASLAVLALAGCSDDPADPATRWLLDVEAQLPPALSEVGLFTEVTSRSRADGVIAYSPAHALFSNGLDKERLLYIPVGGAIDPAQPSWDFPVGTVFAKTFLSGVAARPVETRLLFRRSGGWDYGLYAWRDDGEDADAFAGNWAEKTVELEGDVTHTLPARLDCRVCHETSEESFGTPVLGVSAHQLTGEIAAALPFVSTPAPADGMGRTAAETAAFGYFIGNCVSCHTGGDGTNASFSLFPDEAVERTVNRETESETGEGIRVVPGDPASSVLYITVVQAREPDYAGVFKAMPPIGLTFSDAAAEPILRSWIEEL